MSAQVVQSALAPFLIIDMTKEHVQRGGVLKCLATRSVIYLYFFFFQAEDGIRDGTVTGVQTCALPISKILERQSRPVKQLKNVQPRRKRDQLHRKINGLAHDLPKHFFWYVRCGERFHHSKTNFGERQLAERSEERRVGKEC